jgi:PAS domain S-box-containing protein
MGNPSLGHSPSATDVRMQPAPRAPHPAVSSKKLLRGLTLYSADIISLLDAEGHLLYNSPATERISGYSSEELANVDTFELMHPEDRDEVRRVFGKAVAEPGSAYAVKYRYRTKDGRWVWMEAVASNQLDNPAVRGVVANSRDITDRVQAEEERERLRAQMLHVQKLESLGVLATGVAHDFNNLLTVILGEAEMLLLNTEAQSPSQVRDAASAIRDVTERARELTELLLAYAGRGPLMSKRVNAAELVLGMRPLLELTVGTLGRLALADLDTSCFVEVDPRQLRQVVMNLVQNAVESSAREVLVEVRVERCELDLERIGRCDISDALRPGPHLNLSVDDDGDGIADAVRKRIFDPFFSTKEKGRGLGLAAVHGIVQRHHAGLSVQRSPRGGTRVSIYFPLAEPPSRVSDQSGLTSQL